ncbi:MAG: DDE-type integrase/transposase/recombinase [Actinomycetota bacterium]|nr:DDE-type integrase/transposase/recombinase [Actinomycetota bacterium]
MRPQGRDRGSPVPHPRPEGVEDGAGRGGDRRRHHLPGGARRPAPAAWHHVEQYANNPVEADHSRLKHRHRPMRGLRTDRTAQTVIAGHAFVQNLRRGHYEIATDTPSRQRLAAAFTRTRHRDLTTPHGQAERVSRSKNATAPLRPVSRAGEPGLCRPYTVECQQTTVDSRSRGWV